MYKKTSESAIIFLVLYVDDILLIENDIPMLQLVKTWLSQKFFMKDLGKVSYIFGIKIYREKSKRMLGFFQSRCREAWWVMCMHFQKFYSTTYID